jgi:predicted Fe-Mo cluster-binding NifX family protein
MEKYMKIAVVTDDHKTISAHFGRAVFYEVFTISEGKITGQETLSKPAHNQFVNESHAEPGYAHGLDPAAEGRHARMLEPICDCQILLARGMGQGAYNSLGQAGIKPILTDILEIDHALKSYLDGQLVDHPEWLH